MLPVTHSPTLSQASSNPTGLAGILDIPSPSPLPEPPAWQVNLLEQPWYFAGTLLGIAIVLVLLFARRDELRKGLARGGPLALASGMIVLIASLVHTPREQMRKAATNLVASVTNVDIPALRAALTPDARLDYFGGIDVNAILTQVETSMTPGQRWAIKDYSIEQFQAQATSKNSGIVQIKIRVISEAVGFPHRSWWKITMQRAPDGTWQASRLEPLAIQFENNVR